MRAIAFALGLLVLGSVAAAAQKTRPIPTEWVLDRVRDTAAISVGALFGFFLAEPLGVSGLVGTLGGITIGAWWYARHEQPARPQIRG